MLVESVQFKGHLCFKQWAAFETIQPINVIIGRNNTGKSHLLDLAAACCAEVLTHKGWWIRCKGRLSEAELKMVFNPQVGGGGLGGNHWEDNGKWLVNAVCTWDIDEQGTIKAIGLEGVKGPANVPIHVEDARKTMIATRILNRPVHLLSSRRFCRLVADRDIRVEAAQNGLQLDSDGRGATNIMRRYVTSSNPKLPRELIQRDLRLALNQVFGSDGTFSEIVPRQHDEQGQGPTGPWEIFLGEEKKGLIPLSSSGSGLKTVLLVLLNLLVVPNIEEKPKSQYVFAFEELENNLHPALLRRLFAFVEDYAIREEATVFLTTHSSVALDVFGLSKNAQLIHVTHNGESASVKPISAHFDSVGVISDLGAKPSDLLQANGIVWVEGPSDRIYLNRWIELFSEGKLREGRDYQCAFYGGALLARSQFVPPDQAVSDLANLLRLNANIVVVCDSDRTAQTGEDSKLKERVIRIQSEVRNIPNALMWITDAKEIENYLPGTVLGSVFKLDNLPDPSKYEPFLPSGGQTSYIESHLKRKTLDKVDLAAQATPFMTKENMAQRFDLQTQVEAIIERIQKWNG